MSTRAWGLPPLLFARRLNAQSGKKGWFIFLNFMSEIHGWSLRQGHLEVLSLFYAVTFCLNYKGYLHFRFLHTRLASIVYSIVFTSWMSNNTTCHLSSSLSSLFWIVMNKIIFFFLFFNGVGKTAKTWHWIGHFFSKKMISQKFTW